MNNKPHILSVSIDGYRPFLRFKGELAPLLVIAGANGAGKSALFEFLRVLRDGMSTDLGEVVAGIPPGRYRTAASAEERITWEIDIQFDLETRMRYRGEMLVSPEPRFIHEHVCFLLPDGSEGEVLLGRRGYEGNEEGIARVAEARQEYYSTRFMAGGETGGASVLHALRESIRTWRFFDAFTLDTRSMRTPAPPNWARLEDNGVDLNARLYHLSRYHAEAFDALNRLLLILIPGFIRLAVSEPDANGLVTGRWLQEQTEREQTLADLSDGTLRLIYWGMLSVLPEPPALICIDEPDLGLHPRVLPALAGILQKLGERTQVLLTTHNSYFLSLFDLEEIGVMRMEGNRSVLVKPKDSRIVISLLEDPDISTVEWIHRSGELESFS